MLSLQTLQDARMLRLLLSLLLVLLLLTSSSPAAVSLPKPSISMNPVGEVTWGQDVAITCSISTQHLGGTFILQKTSGSFRKNQTSSTSSATFRILQVTLDNEGLYHCQYDKSNSSQSYNSPLSDSVRLSVTVSLPKPNISMNSVGEVTWCQDVSITCSILTQHLGGTFILQKTSGSFRKTQTLSANSATFSISQVTFDNEGLYQCQYETQVSSRNFMSPHSDSVRLSITVPLQQPSIYLTSPNEGLVWGPEGAEITKGYSFVITCSISSHYPGGVFSLIFSGSDMTNTKPAVNQSASFNFPVAEYEHQGNYSCVYEVTLSSRKFTSNETAIMSVTIKFPFLPLFSSVVGLLLLSVLVVVCVVSRRRLREMQCGAVIRSQGKHHEDEEEEQHYINSEPVNSKQTRGLEEEESDEDHDYENTEGHDSVGNKISHVAVEGNSENEFDSDTDDDYVNVQKPFAEDFLDIYGEDSDVYEDF